MVSSIPLNDVLFHCPSCGTEMCVSPEYLEISGPCIACGTETSAQRALVHAAQARLLSNYEAGQSSEGSRVGVSGNTVDEVSDEITLLAQDNDSWLLPDTGSAMRSPMDWPPTASRRATVP